ncbi:MAG: addiction module protein [Pyrinomonadaceae bacterium]|nr:addiction module protein [Acidobacteriota bacterium]
MSVIAEVEKLAFSLPENERAKLAERLWESLPEDFIDEAEIEEALRRDREMDEDPSKVITLGQLDTLIANRPRRK